jgi:hypothetical protein
MSGDAFHPGAFADLDEIFLTTGYSASQRLLIVAHTDREGRVRIINARDVTAAERRTYKEDDEKPGR